MSNKYSVTTVVQSKNNEPVETGYSVNTDELGVIESVVQLLGHNKPAGRKLAFPPPTVLSITIRLTDLDK